MKHRDPLESFLHIPLMRYLYTCALTISALPRTLLSYIISAIWRVSPTLVCKDKGIIVYLGRNTWRIIRGLGSLSKAAIIATYSVTEEGVNLAGLPFSSIIYFQRHYRLGKFAFSHKLRHVKIEGGGIFHPKIYWFELPGNRAVAVLSSANLTELGLKNNFEYAVLIRDNDTVRELSTFLDAIGSGEDLSKLLHHKLLFCDSLVKALKDAIDNMKERMYIVTPFLDEVFMDYVINIASERDAKILLFVPYEVDEITYKAARKLLEAGVGKLNAIKYLHAKILIVDNRIILFTTANFTWAGYGEGSRELNVGLCIEDEELARFLVRILYNESKNRIEVVKTISRTRLPAQISDESIGTLKRPTRATGINIRAEIKESFLKKPVGEIRRRAVIKTSQPKPLIQKEKITTRPKTLYKEYKAELELPSRKKPITNLGSRISLSLERRSVTLEYRRFMCYIDIIVNNRKVASVRVRRGKGGYERTLSKVRRVLSHIACFTELATSPLKIPDQKNPIISLGSGIILKYTRRLKYKYKHKHVEYICIKVDNRMVGTVKITRKVYKTLVKIVNVLRSNGIEIRVINPLPNKANRKVPLGDVIQLIYQEARGHQYIYIFHITRGVLLNPKNPIRIRGDSLITWGKILAVLRNANISVPLQVLVREVR